MGDAGQGGLNAVVRDELGREFDADLSATVQRTALVRPMEAGLTQGSRYLSAQGGRASFALAIADRGETGRLRLASGQAEAARVFAGSMPRVGRLQ